MSVSINGTNGLTFGDGSAQNTGGYTGFRNRIINGDMRIDQRNAGGSIGAITGSAYTLDRWGIIRVGGTSILTPQQSTVAPAGFVNSLVVTAGSGATPAGTEERSLYQRIEGLNCSDLAWGTANAQTVTLSFWVRSSLTGTFGVILTNSAFNRSYVASYTISAANTWEQKSITVAGDTTGTWLTTNGIGIALYWDLGVGTTYSGSATGAWQGAGYEGLTGGAKLSATSGATFYITGVQLEKGSVATPFEFRPYGTEELLCRRYCRYVSSENGKWQTSATNFTFGVNMLPPMRTTPTAILIGSPTVHEYGVAFRAITAIASASLTPSGGYINCTTSTATGGNMGNMNDGAYPSGILLSAEL